MKHILSLLIFCLPLGCFGQVYVGDTNINEVPNIELCELMIDWKLLSNGVEVVVEYGQDRKKKNDGTILDKETGKPVKFVSVIDALNYMENRGWTYLNNLSIQGGNGFTFHYYFRKKKPTK